MLKIGQRNQLQVSDILPFAYHLNDSDNSLERPVVLKESEQDLAIGECIDVFIYTAADGTLLASLTMPKLDMQAFAPLVITGASEHGYFANWGIQPDLYLPQSQCHSSLDIGMSYVISLMLDKQNKLIGTSKIERKLSDNTDSLKKGQAVDLLIYAESPLGYKAIINNKNAGLLFKSDLSKTLKLGEQLNGYIKQIRTDGKVDLTLQLQTAKARESLEERIIDDLKAHGGLSTLTDKSSPEDIFSHFKVSKGAYKKAIGKLYKNKKIKLDKNCIVIIEN
ncbi:CvfB family protein [Glaciecola petra]|uniref:S1-like domain-containing RNA-binding protein n=1 Tax=Glaciecola petra TaxID=3075602 RepID=A0ABU2ZP33_9ALTE|nr:S1-like domain-containing RNA-binding protein [Aestuariibacter sp. P117]MDT0594393.1 S1-like domain-containing RNA-binding protein [Aestuariibacter sp. P117]